MLLWTVLTSLFANSFALLACLLPWHMIPDMLLASHIRWLPLPIYGNIKCINIQRQNIALLGYIFYQWHMEWGLEICLLWPHWTSTVAEFVINFFARTPPILFGDPCKFTFWGLKRDKQKYLPLPRVLPETFHKKKFLVWYLFNPFWFIE